MKYLSNIFLLFCTIITVFYFTGVLFFLTDHESDEKCEMTYMFEYPQFVRVSQEIDHKYPKYGLYAYGEGRMTKKARNMYFDGIPVLFIPGNAGSHQQVRSLSSVALRKALNSGSPYHFDYFTVDLNSEYSALYGPVLYDQLEYVLKSMERILELYKNSPSSPKQIVLIGHSVGGIVAKKAIAELLNNKINSVSILIALAAPLKRGHLYFDTAISEFYKNSSLNEKNILTISIGGGHSDFLVPSYLTHTEGNNTLNLVATNIPRAWVESNHVQIVWCKQIVLAINRALFHSVDRKTYQISTDTDFVKRVFKHHLIYNSGTEHHLKSDFQKLTKINYKGEWTESILKQYTIENKNRLKQPHWYMVGLTALPTYEMLTVLAINLEVRDWVFVCNAAFPNRASRVCVDGEHLTQYSEIIPSSRYKRRLITINMHKLKKNNTEYSHVVFRALPTSEPVTFHVDIYGSTERKTEISLPRFCLTKQILLSQTPEKALVYDIILPELESLLQVYQLFVEPVRCSSAEHHATASLIVPWANEDIHSHFTEILHNPFIIRLQNPKPINAGDAKVRLTLDPSCTYRVSVRLYVIGIFGQIARYYSPFLITNLAVVFLLAFQSQIGHMDRTGTVPIFFTAVVDGLKQSWIIPVVYLLSKVSKHFLRDNVLQPEFVDISGGRVDNIIASLILFAISIIILLIIVATYCISLFTLESTVHKLTLKLLARSVTLSIRFSDYFMIFLQKVPFIVAAVLVALCCTTCGGLALCIGMVFYFLKLTQMSQDYIEQVAWFVIKKLAKKCKQTVWKNMRKNKESPPEQVPTVIEKKAGNNLNKSSSSSSENGDNSEEEASGDTQNEDSVNSEENSACEESDHKQKVDNESTNRGREDDKIASGEINEEQTTNIEHLNENASKNESDEPKKDSPNESGLISNLSSTNNAIFFHSSMFFMWVFVTILNLPAVLTWAHNFKYNTHLMPDESLFSGLLLSISAMPLWQLNDLPRADRRFTTQLRFIILCIIVISLLYATISVYRLNFMLTILFALIVIQQYSAPKGRTENGEAFAKPDEKETETKYDEAKMKID